jgi:CheY-like chemotaxis protein
MVKHRSKTGRLLVVDDNPAIRDLLRRTLTSAGHVVDEASSGEAALRRYQERPCDIVISDIVMPDVEGLGLILALRRRDQRVKIIAMSGGGTAGSEDYLESAHAFGANRTLAKPFTRSAILTMVTELLNEGRSASAPSSAHP